MEIVIIIKWIAAILFIVNIILNLIQYFTTDMDERNLNATMGWICALIWLIM